MNFLIWIGIIICLSQSATLSGLNLAFFSVSKIRLELEAGKDNPDAKKVLKLREDANFLLVTILWANVSVNVLLALLSGSVLAGVSAFIFSTILITIIGEIIPQAYFSRRAIKIASFLSPLLKFYQILLFPIAKPTALLLDRWLGPEAIPFLGEKDLAELIKMHMEEAETEINKMEGKGALNFLALDDLPLFAEGEPIDPESIIKLDFRNGKPIFPEIKPDPADNFLRKIQVSEKKWIIIVDEDNEARIALDSDKFIREAMFNFSSFNPIRHCHRPIMVKDEKTPLGQTIQRLKVHPERGGDDVIDEDIILVWGEQKKIITGSDILGRLLRGIVQNRGISLIKT